MSNVQDAIRSRQCSAMPRLLFCVLDVQLCCVSPLEAKRASQKGVLSGGSSIKLFAR
ncbi:hypothetical protein P4O66_019688 [Electrophorus voltai]|uniref:Uncharacterized protein n=1 Tax=Electrophorus voltai TaxID=2609070 RepID=A0AAD9E341_9TELE|nr:hypothetical protein P4O66_019688 [Electrophorus voltai]